VALLRRSGSHRYLKDKNGKNFIQGIGFSKMNFLEHLNLEMSVAKGALSRKGLARVL
jgi:hypothetical protein